MRSRAYGARWLKLLRFLWAFSPQKTQWREDARQKENDLDGCLRPFCVRSRYTGKTRHTRWCSMAYRVAAARDRTASLL